jgi:hypothetical protein
MPSKIRKAVDHFLVVTKKGYDDTNWIFVIIAGAGVITKLFGVGGLAAAIIAFLLFYIFGRMSLKREKRIAMEKAGRGKRSYQNRS